MTMLKFGITSTDEVKGGQSIVLVPDTGEREEYRETDSWSQILLFVPIGLLRIGLEQELYLCFEMEGVIFLFLLLLIQRSVFLCRL